MLRKDVLTVLLVVPDSPGPKAELEMADIGNANTGKGRFYSSAGLYI